MGARPVISAPLPWLAMLAGRLHKGKKSKKAKRRPLLKFPRSLSITREGKWYIGVLLLIGIAAVNTGNNLLYLVVAALLSLIIISGIMSESTLRGLRVAREFPALVFKNAPVRAGIKVTNGKRHIPSYSFKITELDGPSIDGYVLKIGPGETAIARTEYTFDRRGIIRLTGLKISTRFPFGLFTKGKEETAEDEVLVLPSINLSRPLQVRQADERAGADIRSGKGEGGGLYGLREYTLADDARHIHWKSAARSSRLLLREFENEARHKVIIIFGNYGEPGEVFEEKVDEAAGTANYYIEKGFAVGLQTLSAEIPPEAGQENLIRILQELAVLSPVPGGGMASLKVVSI